MHPIYRFFRCAGQAVLPKLPKWLAKAAGYDLVADMLEVAQEFYSSWRDNRSEPQARVELAAVAQPLPLAQLQPLAAKVVTELAGNQPAEVQLALTQYLLQIPAATRRALRTPADPSGTTVPATLALQQPADVAALLPFGLAQFQTGDRPACLHGDWELLDLLGRGGQGEVWKACRIDDREFVSAIKFCTDTDAKRQLQLAHEKTVVQRVKKARVAGIVALEDYKLDCAPPWLRYELVEGGDLAGLVQQWTLQPTVHRTNEVLRIIAQLARYVGQFHRLEPDPIVHRDLKPANILVRKLGNNYELKIADFGIGHIAAKKTAQHGSGSTKSRHAAPTLWFAHSQGYASPQQLKGQEPDPRDDVFALGVIWYQLLLRDLARDVPTGFGWDEELKALDLSAELIQLLGRCLASVPHPRPKDGQALHEELTALLPRGASATPQPAKTSVPQPPPPPQGESTAERVRRLKGETAKLHEEAQAHIQLHEYEEAATVLESFRAELRGMRDDALLQDVVAKRDTLRQLRTQIHERTRVPKTHDFLLPSLLGQLLALKPNDVEMVELAREFPPPKPGTALTLPGLGLKAVLVPADSFWMGGGGGQPGERQVTIVAPFFLGIHPVTQAQWQLVMGSNPSAFHSGNKGGPEHPVENVSWDDVQEFLQKLNAKYPVDGLVYRLPTEAEWEYACRGGATSKEECSFHFYFDKPTNALNSTQANFDGNNPEGGAAKGPYLQRTTKVGSYRPNKLGQYDMHGNVWEWTADLHENGSARVIRGGSWYSNGSICQAANRYGYAPSHRDYYLGCRLACSSVVK